MAIEVFKGFGIAILAAVIGTLLVAGAEVILAYRDPERSRLIHRRSWRENLRHMLS